MKISITPIIWTYRKIKETDNNYTKDEHEVRVRMWQNGEPIYISTGYSSSVENWNKEHDRPETTHPKFLGLASKIKKIVDDIEYEIKTAEKAVREITHVEIKAKLTQSQDINFRSEKPKKILAYTQSVIDYYEAIGNIGYANVFHANKLTVKKLLNGKDKMFLAFTKSDHEAYETQMAKLSESTKSAYLRTYYRVWNLAIADGLVPKDRHPKQYIKFKAYKKIRTKKRCWLLPKWR